MAQNKNSNYHSERVCKKLYNAVFVSPFRSKTRRVSNQHAQPQNAVSAADVPNTSSPAKVSLFQTKTTHIVHHQTIPSDSEPPLPYFPVHKNEKKVMIEDDDSMHGTSETREAMFSDYISKVKNQMTKTESNVGGSSGGGIGRMLTRRDSLNDKVTSYINRAKLKIRTTTNVGDRKSFSFK